MPSIVNKMEKKINGNSRNVLSDYIYMSIRDVLGIVLQKDMKGRETKREIDECNSKR